MDISSHFPTFANLPQAKSVWYPQNRMLGGLRRIGKSLGPSWIQTLHHPGGSMFTVPMIMSWLNQSILLKFCYISCISHYQAIHSWC